MRGSLLKASGKYLDKKERHMNMKISLLLLDFVVSANDFQRQSHNAISPRTRRYAKNAEGKMEET